MSNVQSPSPPQHPWPHPNPASLPIETWSAWAAYLLAPASFIISVFAILFTIFGVCYSVYTYSETKKEEAKVESERLEQQKFENAFRLLTILGGENRQNGAFAELAAIKELERYPKYHFIYEYMLKRFTKFEKDATKDDDKEFFIEYIGATRALIDSTK